MSLQGATISYPFRPDQRGTLATVSEREQIVAESIASIIETRKGERVMLPDYGISDYVFSVRDAGFAARLAYEVEQQVKRYEPLVRRIRAQIGTLEDEKFIGGFTTDEQRTVVNVEYTVRGS